MFHNDAAVRQLVRVLVGTLVLTAIMLGAYAIMGKLGAQVYLGAAAGVLISMGNFLALSITVTRAADRAEKTGEVEKATLMVRGSAPVRLLIMAGIYIVILKSGRVDPLAAVLPLVFVQASVMITEYFRKDK